MTGVRRDRWDGLEADTMFGLMCQLPVTVLHDSAHVARAWELSRRYDEHPLYDMVYVALAERLGDTLVTADEVLLRRLGHLP
ncbi:MAG: type II toxin-antitoxin system VapC family toxin [Nocardioidaceae bacterium]|nr:type II toxin-antitoxin system VapC family toxin [Nocardioidaceae bacterium]